MVFMKGMDIIFCCNVLIYFDTSSKRMVIQHFYNNLTAHGFLFLGHSESLYGISEDFRLVHMPSSFHKIQLMFPAACANHLLHFIAQHDGIACRES